MRHVEALDLSGNELRRVDESLNQLESLEELNLANNRLESLPEIDLQAMQRLRSINLEGNPLASHIASATIRQLAHPPHTPGQTPSQVIGTLLAHASRGQGGMGAKAGSATESVTTIDEVTAINDCVSEPLPRRQAKASDLDVDKLLAGEGDAHAPWRKEQKVMLKEVERLQARIDELEAAAASRDAEAPSQKTGGSSSPAWLQEGRLSQTLPSRQRGLLEGNEASEVKEQLREEQRRSKRLEKEVQKMSERLGESDMAKGGTGSIPHFDFSEVELGEVMAQGGFSVVHRGYWHTTKIACKKLFDPNISQELLAEFDNEVQKLEQIRHPNILMLLAVHRKPPALAMITEIVEGGSFFQLLHSPSKFNCASGPLTGISRSRSMDVMEHSGTAIAFLHARGIAHRDVKTLNVLLSPSFDVKLCDFGLARMKSELMTGAMQFAGTPNYMAPEIFRNQKYTENVDVFAYGTMLWEALVVDIPWANFDPADIRERVVAGQMLPMNSDVSSAAQALIKACWTADRTLRPSMAQIMPQMRALPR